MTPRPTAVRSPRRAALLGAAAALCALLAAPRASLADQVHDSADGNYILKLADTFKWVEVGAQQKAQGVVEIAHRELEKLMDKEGTKATGQGFRVMLAVTDTKDSKDVNPDFEGDLFDWQQLEFKAKQSDPAQGPSLSEADAKASDDLKAKIEKSLEELVSKPDVQELLLSRWGKDRKAWPKGEVTALNERMGPIPAAVLTVEAPCTNLQGNEGPCIGRLVVCVLRGKLYRLAMWAFPAPRDREHLKMHLDEIPLSLEFMKTDAKPRKPPPPGTPGGPGAKDPADPKAKEEEEKKARQLIKDPAYGFEVTKPEGFVAIPFDRSAASQREVGFNFNAQSGGTAYANVDLTVKRIGRAGTMAWDRNTYLPGLWVDWLNNHKEGALGTLPFPPYSGKTGFLVLPDYSKKKDKSSQIDRPKPKDPKKPNELEPVSVSDMERLGVAEEVKNSKLGNEKVHEVWRFCMTGVLPRVGEDIHMQYCFSSPSRTYVLRVITRYDGSFDHYKAQLTEILSSFRILPD